MKVIKEDAYEIRVRGRASWFACLSIAFDDGTPAQAAGRGATKEAALLEAKAGVVDLMNYHHEKTGSRS